MSGTHNKLYHGNNFNHWKFSDLDVDLNYFSFCHPNPNPNTTHLLKHEFLSLNNQFDKRIWYVECYSVHACGAKSEILLHTGINFATKDSARQAGFAATKAEAAKCQKYHDLQSNSHLQSVAIETTGVYVKSTAPFLSGLVKKLVDVSGDPRECQWLHQHLSLAVVKGNAARILACVRVWSNFTCSFSSSCF